MEESTPKRRLGRPPGSITGTPKDTIHITLPVHLADWVRKQDVSVSAAVTRVLEEAYLRDHAAS